MPWRQPNSPTLRLARGGVRPDQEGIHESETMISAFKPPIIPAAFFGIVLGLAGLGNAWRAADRPRRASLFEGDRGSPVRPRGGIPLGLRHLANGPATKAGSSFYGG
jgi:hypothetical protein